MTRPTIACLFKTHPLLLDKDHIFHFTSLLLNCKSSMASPHLDCRRCVVFTSFVFLSLLLSLPVKTNSLSFGFPSFDVSNPGLVLQGDAFIAQSRIQLTLNQLDTSSMVSKGRALYPTAIQLWEGDDNAATKRLTDFTTQFTFNTAPANSSLFGDGLAFLLVPENTELPDDAIGGGLGLYSVNQTDFSFINKTAIVAVEFDTFRNSFDPSDSHIGIDVNSVKSAAFVNVLVGLRDKTAQAFISYNSTTKNLSVSLSMNESSVPYSVSHIIDLSTVLPRRVQVGFSAATGSWVELHQILNWSFNSTLEETANPGTTPTPQQGATPGTRSAKKGKGGFVIGIVVGISLILVFGVAICWIRLRRKNTRESNIETDQFNIDENFDTEAGPKRFAYAELSQATNNFAIEGKLGEGGFGGVYRGLLTGPGSREIAVKKIKSGSNQGKKEYISEVKIISRLRHRNLVQLLGWCHDHGELLLVYEFMPNGSLDFHLFGCRLALLPWPTRYKIALGLASALLYLHEEWEQSVVHRDIKSSNVMLDVNFNPKLGDFGLARLADHDVGLQTTAIAGTPGYLAPECLLTGRASKESDVYSFGIVALEIACGRKVTEVREEPSKVNLVEWVWDLYGKGVILEAVDSGLAEKFDEEQAKCLMVIGLWCAHPDVSYRPSIKQAIAALNYETPLPSLPSQLPVPIYVAPGMNASLHSSNSSLNMTEGNYPATSRSSIGTSTTSSSQQSGKSISSAYPLQIQDIQQKFFVEESRK